MNEGGAVKAAQNSQQRKRYKLEEKPRPVVSDVEHDQVRCSERVDGAKYEGRGQRAEKRAPKGFHREVVADLRHRKTTLEIMYV